MLLARTEHVQAQTMKPYESGVDMHVFSGFLY